MLCRPEAGNFISILLLSLIIDRGAAGTIRREGNVTKNEYRLYLQGDHWQQIKIARMRIDGFRCQGCGCVGTSSNPLQVHHLTYHNVGTEDVWTDVVTLCRACHLQTHRILQRKTSWTGEHGWCDKLPFSTHVFDDKFVSGLIDLKENADDTERTI